MSKKVKKVQITYEDGSTLSYSGEMAEKWSQMVQADSVFAYVHNVRRDWEGLISDESRPNKFQNYLEEEFQEFEYRHSYNESHVESTIAVQVYQLRRSLGWSQAELAEKIKVSEEVIDRIEDVNNEDVTLPILFKLARVFDLGLSVRFRTFPNIIEEITHLEDVNNERSND